jgi:hypothetical protein
VKALRLGRCRIEDVELSVAFVGDPIGRHGAAELAELRRPGDDEDPAAVGSVRHAAGKPAVAQLLSIEGLQREFPDLLTRVRPHRDVLDFAQQQHAFAVRGEVLDRRRHAAGREPAGHATRNADLVEKALVTPAGAAVEEVLRSFTPRLSASALLVTV